MATVNIYDGPYRVTGVSNTGMPVTRKFNSRKAALNYLNSLKILSNMMFCTMAELSDDENFQKAIYTYFNNKTAGHVFEMTNV